MKSALAAIILLAIGALTAYKRIERLAAYESDRTTTSRMRGHGFTNCKYKEQEYESMICRKGDTAVWFEVEIKTKKWYVKP